MDKNIIGAILVGFLIFIGGCSKIANTSDSVVSGEIKEFSITAKQWEFNPNVITVNKGDKVKLTITSVDVSHGLAISDFNINERLEPGQITNVEFVADKSGKFTFFCSVLCGSGHSRMRGQLIVK
jgi:cytochrome c oxidase subunit 2